MSRPDRAGPLDGMMTGATFGVPLWAAWSVVLHPVLGGRPPQWSAEGMRALLPSLVAFVLSGAALGAAWPLLAAAWRALRPAAPPPPPPAPARRVVILGGGFAGVACAARLEALLGPDPTVRLALVSDTNALLFTPMLAEVAGSSLEPTHITSPVRTSLRRTQVLRARVTGLDLEGRRVLLDGEAGRGRPQELPFDHLVLAPGAVANHFGLDEVRRHTLGFKSLREAMAIRNRVIDLLERAEREPEAGRRRALLTLVVAGAGFAGAELAGALNDFARGALADYGALSPGDLSIVVVHPGTRILPELSPGLAEYARERLAARGVTFLLGQRVAGARAGAVRLATGEELPCGLAVWTAGASPHSLVGALPAARDRRGALQVEPTLAVPGLAGVWAAGDCAAVPDGEGGTCPPTAQHALRQGRHLAGNLHRILRGRAPRPFRFRSLGALCVVGHHTACAELRLPFTRSRTVRFSGLLAWLAWRAIYLAKLPGAERKLRVLFDWTVELFFPRDIVQTLEAGEEPEGRTP